MKKKINKISKKEIRIEARSLAINLLNAYEAATNTSPDIYNFLREKGVAMDIVDEANDILESYFSKGRNEIKDIVVDHLEMTIERIEQFFEEAMERATFPLNELKDHFASGYIVVDPPFSPLEEEE